MNDTTKWLHELFENSPNAILIFQADELILSNQVAQELQAATNFDPIYLLQVARTGIQQENNQQDGCFTCIIKQEMQKKSCTSIPVLLQSNDGKAIHFSLAYRIIDKDTIAIILTNCDQIHRVDNLAQQKRLTRYVNRAYEHERQRISQDLHDSVAQGVYSAIIGVRRIRNGKLESKEVQALTQMIETQLNDTLNEIKEMALDIRPSVLDTFGLGAALKVLANRLEENTGININVIEYFVQPDISEDVQNVLYRIGQEAINNALKHAEASEINLILVGHDHAIQLEIMDDGKGFDISQHQIFNGHSLGLLNMNERVKALNGNFKIDSTPGQGTTVTVRFPTNNWVKREEY